MKGVSYAVDGSHAAQEDIFTSSAPQVKASSDPAAKLCQRVQPQGQGRDRWWWREKHSDGGGGGWGQDEDDGTIKERSPI